MPSLISLPSPWSYDSALKGWLRPLEACESAADNDALCLRGHYELTQVVIFKTSAAIDAKLAAAAWLDLRRRNPEIALELVGDADPRSFLYPIVDGDGASSWCEETFTCLEGGASPDQLFKQLVNRPLPAPFRAQATLIPAAQGGEHAFLLNISHSVVDAQSILALARNYISALVDMASASSPHQSEAWGSEIVRMPLGLEAALELENAPITAERLAEGRGHYEGQVGYLGKHGVTTPLRSQILPRSSESLGLLAARFSQANTERIVAAAKPRGISVASAIVGALLQAQAELHSRGQGEEGAMISYACNGRRWLKTLYRDRPEAPSFATAVNFAFLDTLGAADSSPVDRVQQIGAQMQAIIAGDVSTPVSAWGMKAFMADVYKAARKAQNVDEPEQASCFLTVSSWGNLDVDGLLPTHYKSSDGTATAEVLDCDVSTRLCDKTVIAQPLTLGGKLRIGLAFNERFYETAELAALLSRTQELLLGWAGE